MTEIQNPSGVPERRTPEQWAALVQDHQASGQSQRAFCAARGIGQNSLRYWRRRLEKRAAGTPVAASQGARLVPVDLIEEHAPLAAGSGVTIRTGGGIRIEGPAPLRCRCAQRCHGRTGGRQMIVPGDALRVYLAVGATDGAPNRSMDWRRW